MLFSGTQSLSETFQTLSNMIFREGVSSFFRGWRTTALLSFLPLASLLTLGFSDTLRVHAMVGRPLPLASLASTGTLLGYFSHTILHLPFTLLLHGLSHGLVRLLLGRPSMRAQQQSTRAQVLAFLQEKYPDIGKAESPDLPKP